jgi:putative copper export protein
MDWTLAWSDVIGQFIEFLGAFSTIGAVGYRFGVLPLARAHELDLPFESVRRSSAVTAAAIGFVGSLVAIGSFVVDMAGDAAEKHQMLGAYLTSHLGRSGVPLALLIVATIAFAAAYRLVPGAFAVAAIATLAFTLRSLVSGHWASMVNPIHRTAASLWIGTLAVLMVAGIPAALHARVPSESRGPIVARLVAAFSSVALGSAAVLVISGVTTAWRHLKYVAALWTTSYGITLDCKLVAVAIVAALGWWNWKRISPICHTAPGTQQLKTSARRELTVAFVVLVITSVLVSLPTPELPPH